MNKESLWLSYIIPLYNCGTYIAKCLDSVLTQGIEPNEYEVIVVNDGSTDNGAEIVSRYCQKYENFRLVNKENGGVSSARNRGIDEARGEYVYFMDADDYLLPGGMKILRNEYLERYGRADVVKFQCYTVDKYYKSKEWEYIRPHKMYFQGTLLEYGNQFNVSGAVYVHLLSRKLIVDNSLQFQPYVISEDIMFMFSLFCNMNATIIATSLDIYRYCVRENSAMTKIDDKHVKRFLDGVFDYVNKLRAMREESFYRKEIFDDPMTFVKRKAFIRVCYLRTYKEVKSILHKAKQENFFPIKDANTPIYKFINKVYNKPLLVYLFSLPFRHIFIPYIKPYIKRN